MITDSTRSSRLTQDPCFTGGRGEGIDKTWNYSACVLSSWLLTTLYGGYGRWWQKFERVSGCNQTPVHHTHQSIHGLHSHDIWTETQLGEHHFSRTAARETRVCVCVCISTMRTSSRDKGYLFHYSAFEDLCMIKVCLYAADKIIQFCAIINVHDEALGMAKEKECSV